MKSRLFILTFGMIFTMPLWAAYTKGIHVNYSTTGVATYADGTPILEGERFLLVWFKPDVEIDLSKDITGDKDSFIGEDWWWVSEADAENGCCPPHTWSLTSKYTNYSSGYVQLYLLDTRISGTELAPMVKNKRNQNFPSVVNAVVPITGATVAWSDFSVNPYTISGPAPATAAWTILAKSTPVPVIVSMVYANGVATVGATNTVPTANYVLRGSLDLTFTNTTWTTSAKAGAGDTLTPLVISDPSADAPAAFYRIETVGD